MALIRLSAPLSRELTRTMPSRPFRVRFWDGGDVEATEPRAPTFLIRRPGALAHIIAAPGSLGLGRAYVEGSLDVDDLEAGRPGGGDCRFDRHELAIREDVPIDETA